MLGGSAVHFALAASFFTDVHIVGPVGDDFGEREYAVLRDRRVDTSAIERVAGGRTFFWRGRYEHDLAVAHTEDTQLGVFTDFLPKLSDGARAADTLFLANIQPDLQRTVREQCQRARFVALDSMNMWIETARDSLIRTLTGVDCVILNDAELRMLSEEPSLPGAARRVMGWGPRVVVAKQGEYGVSLFAGDEFFSLPAYPLETVRDPTGAGDSFAGGFLGYLAALGPDEIDGDALRAGAAYGTALASFNVEDFGTERVRRLSAAEITDRVEALERMTRFELTARVLQGVH
jgi:sugar/nucleoside kinase (ribokinase family)